MHLAAAMQARNVAELNRRRSLSNHSLEKNGSQVQENAEEQAQAHLTFRATAAVRPPVSGVDVQDKRQPNIENIAKSKFQNYVQSEDIADASAVVRKHKFQEDEKNGKLSRQPRDTNIPNDHDVTAEKFLFESDHGGNGAVGLSYQGFDFHGRRDSPGRERKKSKERPLYDHAKHDVFSNKYKDMKDLNPKKPNFSPGIMEHWLNSTLDEAANMEIPGCLLNPDNVMPLARYNISKDELIAEGIHSDVVNGIYRALFSHSFGFFQMIQNYVQVTKNPDLIKNNLWRVFTILLEYCSKTNYEMLVRSLHLEHEKQLNDQMVSFKKMIQGMEQLQERTQMDLTLTHQTNESLKKQLEEQELLSKKFQEELERTLIFHEEEVQIRRTIMERLNILYAMHRNLQSVYDKAKQEILEMQQKATKGAISLKEYFEMHMKNRVEMEKKRQEIEQLNNDLDMANQKIVSKQDEIDHLAGEKWKFENKAKELEFNLNTQDEVYENLKRKQDQQYQELVECKQELEKVQKQLADEKIEQKKYYDLQCTTNEELKDVKEKYHRLARYNGQIEDIQKDRDDRIQKARKEMEELLLGKDELEAQFNCLKAENDTNLQLLEKARTEAEEMQVQMDQMYNERNRLLTEKKQFELDKQAYQTTISNKDEKILEMEKSKSRLSKDGNGMALKLRELFEQANIDKREFEEFKQQTINQISTKDNMIRTLEKTNQSWQDKYNQESESYELTRQELITLQEEHQKTDRELHDAKTKQKQHDQAIERYTLDLTHAKGLIKKFRADIEELERQIFSQQENIKQLEKQIENDKQKAKEQRQKFRETIKRVDDQSQMTMEDTFQQAIKMNDMIIQLTNKLEDRDVNILDHEQLIASYKAKVAEQEEENAELNKQIDGLKEEIEVKKVEAEDWQKQLYHSQKQCQQLEENVAAKDQELKEAQLKMEESVKQLQGEISKMEQRNCEILEQLTRTEESVAKLEEEKNNQQAEFDKDKLNMQKQKEQEQQQQQQAQQPPKQEVKVKEKLVVIQVDREVQVFIEEEKADMGSQTDPFINHKNFEPKERSDDHQLKEQENIIAKQLQIQTILGKGIHSDLKRMKELLDMKEMQKRKDLDKELKEEKKKKIKKSGEYDLYAHMAQLSSKNERNAKQPSIQQQAQKKQLTIEEIQRRDQERERERLENKGEWNHFQSKKVSGSISNALGTEKRSRGLKRSSIVSDQSKQNIAATTEKQVEKKIVNVNNFATASVQQIPNTLTLQSAAPGQSNTLQGSTDKDGAGQRQLSKPESHRSTLIQVQSPSEKEIKSSKSSALLAASPAQTVSIPVKKNVFQTIGADNVIDEKHTASSNEESQPGHAPQHMLQQRAHRNSITLRNKQAPAETSYSTSLDNVRVAQQQKEGVQDMSNFSNPLSVTNNKDAQNTFVQPDELKVQFRQGFFDARPKTGVIGLNAPLSERNNEQQLNYFNQTENQINDLKSSKQHNVSALNAESEPLYKKSFRIRQSVQDAPLSEHYKESVLVNFNHDVLKSVYELRQQHEALVSRPVSSQPFTARRRNLMINTTSQKFMITRNPGSPIEMNVAPPDELIIKHQKALQNREARPQSFHGNKGYKSEMKNSQASRPGSKKPALQKGHMKSSQKLSTMISPLSPQMQSRIQHAYMFRGQQHLFQNASEVCSPRLETEVTDQSRVGQILGVSGKSVSGKVADHNNFMIYSSPMGCATQRDLQLPGKQDPQSKQVNSARTGSLILMTGTIGARKKALDTNLTSRLSEAQTPRQTAETGLRKRIKLDKAKSTNLKNQIKQGEINKTFQTAE